MGLEQTKDQVKALRALFAADPRAHALALADQLNWLSIEFGLRGDYDSATACTAEAFEVITTHLDPFQLPPGERFKYAGLVSSVAASLIMDQDAGRALPVLDAALDAHALLEHLAGTTVEQPTFSPPPAPPTPEEAARSAAFEHARRERERSAPWVSPYADDQPPVPFASPEGAFARPDRGWQLAVDWTLVQWSLLCARARVLASVGQTDRALDDAVAALAINLAGTELDYARLVSGAGTGLSTAWLLIEGAEPEGGRIAW